VRFSSSPLTEEKLLVPKYGNVSISIEMLGWYSKRCQYPKHTLPDPTIMMQARLPTASGLSLEYRRLCQCAGHTGSARKSADTSSLKKLLFTND
jgi:hypothetical protein